MRHFIPLLLFLLSSNCMYAQVGVNNPAPDDNAILDLKATNKGLLIPRMTTVQREAMSSMKFAQGMLVFDTDLNIMFVGYNDSLWYALNPWKTEYKTNNNADTAHMTTMTAANIKHGNVGIGISAPTEKLEVHGWTKSTGFKGYGITPIGGIIMWSGSVSNIPDGWALCSGQVVNGQATPDLRERFVVGAGGDNSSVAGSGYNPNEKGGSNLVTLTIAQMPQHSHSGYTLNESNHRHSYWDGYAFDSDNRSPLITNSNKSQLSTTNRYGTHGDLDNQWLYSVARNSEPGTAHRHQILPDGSGHSHENRPPYYALAYIMRVY